MRRGDGFPGHTIGDSSAIAPGGCADAARQCDDGTGRRSGVACGPQPGTPSPSGVALDSVGVGDIDAEPLSDGVDAAAHRSRAESRGSHSSSAAVPPTKRTRTRAPPSSTCTTAASHLREGRRVSD